METVNIVYSTEHIVDNSQSLVLRELASWLMKVYCILLLHAVCVLLVELWLGCMQVGAEKWFIVLFPVNNRQHLLPSPQLIAITSLPAMSSW